MSRFLFLALVLMVSYSCQAPRELSTVASVNFERYAGTWYEIARLPNRFEEGLDRVSATYTLKSDGDIEVLNQGYDESGNVKASTGKAYLPDEGKPGRLKVQFFWPFAGDYYIIELDEAYNYALVGTPSRKYLWILAREKQLPQDRINYLVELAQERGFETENLLFVKQ
ncbi:lipocalin family protein [Carboxylicivirga taeanensis]|uniref:lipocalin family protein n=1 Tax=Carboxylicivirga taeanensis TaxID=1416875 RepID=UPI003F6DC1C7